MSGVSTKTVDESEEGMRLDRWFGLHFPQFSHGQVQKCLRKGQIRIDGSKVKANARLEAGQLVRIPPVPDQQTNKPPIKEPRPLSKRNRDFVRGLVIYQDDDYIAINKPAGLPVQGGSGQERHVDGLLDGLKFDAQERPKLVHRLDKDTSGVLLLARSRQAAAQIGKSLRQHETTKLYWALVIGVPKPPIATIDAPLEKMLADSGQEKMVVSTDDKKAQKAVTRYALQASAGQKLSYVVLSPVTGRTHQLRIHMSAIGHPIVGDGKYGGKLAHPGGEIANRLHLHARSMRFTHPGTGRKVEISAPLSEHMHASWSLFGFDTETDEDPFEPDDCAGACSVR